MARLRLHFATACDDAIHFIIGVYLMNLLANSFEVLIGSPELARQVVESVFAECDFDSFPESLDGILDALALLL